MGFQPIFCLCGGMDIGSLLESTLTGLGYELVDLEVVQFGRKRLLRLFIDKPGGVTIDDCTYVSNHVSRLLAVELDYDYDRLEVSSPGLDRPLKKESDFARFAGETVKIKLRIPQEGKRKFTGVLLGLDNGRIKLDVDGAEVAIALDNLDKARLVPQF
jgi:ribosome maturation factor RimP